MQHGWKRFDVWIGVAPNVLCGVASIENLFERHLC